MEFLLCFLACTLLPCILVRTGYLTFKQLPFFLAACWLVCLAAFYLYAPIHALPFVYIALFCLFLAWQDFATLYISPIWCLWGIGFLAMAACFPKPDYPLLASISFGLPAMAMAWKKNWMGRADGWFLLGAGYVLGLERMLVCMFLTIVLAFGVSLVTKARRLPFLTFLCAGFLVSFPLGWQIYAMMFL